MSYNMYVERLDGTVVDHPATVKYPSHLNDYAKSLCIAHADPQVYITVWKHDKGEVRKKYYSEACWELETFALEMFEQMCKEHDWYYDYSDDHNVWKRGRFSESKLLSKYNWVKSRYPAAAEAIWDMHCPKNLKFEIK
jgi:hypothetical protein